MVTLYTAPGCNLCDEAEKELRALALRLEFEVEAVTIKGRPELEREFGSAVPVVVIEGYELVRAPIRPGTLETRLATALASR